VAARGTRTDVHLLRWRTEAAESLHRRRTAAALRDVDRILAHHDLGSTTRRILQRHRVGLARLDREAETRRALTELESAVDAREPRPATGFDALAPEPFAP
jgi:hypothetical protein